MLIRRLISLVVSIILVICHFNVWLLQGSSANAEGLSSQAFIVEYEVRLTDSAGNNDFAQTLLSACGEIYRCFQAENVNIGIYRIDTSAIRVEFEAPLTKEFEYLERTASCLLQSLDPTQTLLLYIQYRYSTFSEWDMSAGGFSIILDQTVSPTDDLPGAVVSIADALLHAGYETQITYGENRSGMFEVQVPLCLVQNNTDIQNLTAIVSDQFSAVLFAESTGTPENGWEQLSFSFLQRLF